MNLGSFMTKFAWKNYQSLKSLSIFDSDIRYGFISFNYPSDLLPNLKIFRLKKVGLEMSSIL